MMTLRQPLLRWTSFWCAVAASILCCAGMVQASSQVTQTPLPGANIPKYVDPLPTFAGARVPAGSGYTTSYEEFRQKALPASVYAALPAPFNTGTLVWGYKTTDGGGKVYGPLWPGYTVEAQRGTPTTATYLNNLATPGLQKYLTVDQTIHWADPLKLFCTFTMVNCLMTPNDPCCKPFAGPVPVVTHLHGGEVKSNFDGGPEQWFTPDGKRGGSFSSAGAPPANGALYDYPNGQEATTLWFHDHALGATRTNVYSGVAAFYFLRDSRDTGLANNPIRVPAGDREVEIVIQDRQFDTNGQLLFPDGFPAGLNGPPTNPDIHPFWIPEFFGDVIVVNGKSWPYLNVEPRRYRLRLLDGSNARFYNLALFDRKNNLAGPPLWQIGTDGGLLDAPVQIAWPKRLLIAPGERADIIVDFSAFAGKTLTLVNDARAPFPGGSPVDPNTTGQVMQFRVGATVTGSDTSCNPAVAPPAAGACSLRAASIVRLANPATGTLAAGVVPVATRQLVLKEIAGAGGPIEVLLNNTKWSGITESSMMTPTPTPVAQSFAGTYTVPRPGGGGPNWLTEGPQVGTTEVWEIINITMDAHPIHLHLVQFQLMNHQPIQANKYMKDWMAAFPGGVFKPGDGPPFPYNVMNADGAIGGNIAVSPYLMQKPAPPNPNEAGWKDTVVMYPGTVTRIVVRWTPQDVAVGSESPGLSQYSFDPADGPGYVWHCHILDHEDNEMMRPYQVRNTPVLVKGPAAGPMLAMAEECPNCGKEPGRSKFTVVHQDGKKQAYGCPRCALTSVNPKTVKSATATDFFSGKPVEAELATYVKGTTVGSCCTPYWVAFEKTEHAEKFAKAFGGTLLNYKEAVRELSARTDTTTGRHTFLH